MKKSSNGLYDVDNSALDQVSYQRLFGTVFEPFRLFGTKNHGELNDESDDESDYYRPITPIQDAVKEPPKEVETLCKLIKERIVIKDGISSVPPDHQRELVDILIYELKSVWPDLRKQGQTPSLTPEENKELRRRVAVEVVRLTGELFKKYVEREKELNDMGVFSSKANISRLKTQLANEASNCLNIFRLRRKVLAVMKQQDEDTESEDQDSYIADIKARVVGKEGSLPKKTFDTRDEASNFFRAYELEKLQQTLNSIKIDESAVSMATIPQKPRTPIGSNRTSNLRSGVSPMPMNGKQDQETEHVSVMKSASDTISLIEEEGIAHDKKPTLQKSTSFHTLTLDDDTFAELNISAVKAKKRTSVHKLKSMLDTDIEANEEIRGDHFLVDDLKRLTKINEENDEVDSDVVSLDDLPPLLQVHQKYKTKKKRTVLETGNYKENDLVSEIKDVLNSELTESQVESFSRQKADMDSQPDVVSSLLPNKVIARTYNARVSSRVFKSGVTLPSYPVMYNEFKGEVDDSAIKQLDSHLFAGDELKEVYDEILRSVTKKHFDFDKDMYVEKCLEPPKRTEQATSLLAQSKSPVSKPTSDTTLWPVYLPRETTDGTIPLRSGKRPLHQKMVNQSLNANSSEGLNKAVKAKGDKEDKSYTSWLAWWRTAISSEDYLKYLMIQGTDFLSNIFHLDDLRAETEHSEGKKSHRKELEAEKEKRKPSEAMIKKSHFEDGFWNPSVVLLGGLGKDPESPNCLIQDTNDVHSYTSSIDQYILGDVKSGGKLSVGLPHTSRSRSSTTTKNRGITTGSHLTIKSQEISKITAAVPIQLRLERIWTTLKMKENDRLDMALKYSSDGYLDHLPKFVEKLESVAALVAKRESALGELERFEKTASDPNRFFEKGQRGHSSARTEEEIIRARIQKRLNTVERKLRVDIGEFEKCFGDQVTYEGRYYLSKMASDKVEMLFWLQQERRKSALRQTSGKREDGFKAIDLPPVEVGSIL